MIAVVQVCVPVAFCLALPHTIVHVAGPATLLSLGLAVAIVAIVGQHYAELWSAMPQQSFVYAFMYTYCGWWQQTSHQIAGELWAFLFAVSTFVDYCCLVATTARMCTAHVDGLFAHRIANHTVFSLLHLPVNHTGASSGSGEIVELQLDTLATLLVVGAVVFNAASVRAAFICGITLWIVCMLVVITSIIIAFMHVSNGSTPLSATFFTGGFSQVLHATSVVLIAFVGFESVTFLLMHSSQVCCSICIHQIICRHGKRPRRS